MSHHGCFGPLDPPRAVRIVVHDHVKLFKAIKVGVWDRRGDVVCGWDEDMLILVLVLILILILLIQLCCRGLRTFRQC